MAPQGTTIEAGEMINEKLRVARQQKRWTIEKAAAMVGVSKLTYSRWEHSTQVPHLSTLDMLCAAFEMDAYTLGYAPEPQIKQEEAPIQLFLPGADMNTSRRAFLTEAASLIVAPYIFTEPAKALINEAALTGFDQATQACWNLSNGNELAIASAMIPTYAPKLAQIARIPSKQQQKAASLLSENLQLNGILAAHKLDFTAKEVYTLQAIEYAKQAQDYNALASAHVQLAVAHYYQQHPQRALDVYREALLYINQLSPLMQARIYMGAAEAYARNGRKTEALRFSGLAYQVFPSQPDLDPSYRYADFGQFALMEHRGLIHHLIEQPGEALDIFTQINEPSIPERIRLEVINYQAEAAIGMKDLERSCTYIEAGTTGAQAMNSSKRLSEAQAIYQRAVTVWPKERQLQQLGELYQH